MAPSNMEEMWREASKRYAKKSGKRLEDLPKPRSTDELMQQVEKENNRYEDFRANKGMLFKTLAAAMKPVELVGNLAAGGASAVFPASGTVFGAAMYLINAARGVSASLDAIAGLMEHLKDFTVRLNVYNKAAMSKELTEQLTETLVTVVEIFARATKKIKEGSLGRFMSFGKNVLLGNDTKMQDLLAKLEKLTKTEGHLVGAETLVEVKNAGKDVHAIHVAVKEQSTAMANLQLHAQEQSSILVGMRDEAKEEKDMKHVEGLKLLLQPSAAPQERFEQIKREQVPGSGDWIRLEEPLTTWVDPGEQPILWISGNPGSGKSFLTYNIINFIRELAGNDSSEVPDDACISYFFFRDNDAKTQSVQQALRDTAYQLTKKNPLYAKYLAARAPSAGEITSVRTAWSTLFADYWLGDEGTDIVYLFLDGLDESFSAEREILFELLKDVQDAGEKSRMRVIMLGRPQVTDELVMALDQDLPTIHVEPSKNGADIARYVEASIANSRALNKASKKLKTTIIETLTQKAGGMFMWVKLMILDLNRKAQKLRESDVQKALQQAPKLLTDMIKHVLEGYSSSISEDEASDLNDMLMWVSLARRPLFLGEIDAALRLKSEEGEGLIDLEGNLRKTYASLFTLSRDDGLTTAELLASKRTYDDDEEEEEAAGADDGAGEDDLDFPTQFDSNPKTTTVSFSHASISDFFRDPKQGKVKATGDDCPEVGVNLAEAQIQMARICTDIIVDENLRGRMKEAVSLAIYAGRNWAEHLEQADFERATNEDKLAIGMNVAHMMCDKGLFPGWADYRGHTYFSDNFAQPMVPWLRESINSGKLDGETSNQLSCVNEGNALDIFEPVIRFEAQLWLAPTPSINYSVTVVPAIIYSWQARKRGEVVQETVKLTSEHIISLAEWAGLEENAEWHRRLAMTFREFELWDDAQKHFEKALELDSGMWLAQVGIAMLHLRRKDYDVAIKFYEAVLPAVDADTVYDEEFRNLHGRYRAHYDIAECYFAMSGQIDKAFTRATFGHDSKAHEHLQLAVNYKPTDYESFARCVYFYHVITTWDAAEDDETSREGEKHTDMPDVPTDAECYQHIMQSARDLNSTMRDDKHTNFVHSLMEYKHDDDDYYQILSKAARETGELEWLQDRYRAAISAAKKDLQPVTAACLSLCLADMLYKHGDQDRAMHIWETVGLESGQTTRVETEIALARWQALNKLGMYCITRAFEDESQAERWAGKMERIVAKSQRRRGTAFAGLDSVPLNDIALYLSAWYCKQGRIEEAHELVKPHVKDAIVILSDDDPSNDIEGYISLGNVFLAVNDDVNALAVFQALRPVKNGVAVLASDKKGSGAKGAADVERADKEVEAEESEDRDESAGAEPDATKNEGKDQKEEGESNDTEYEEAIDRWGCDGVCVRSFNNFDNALLCRMGCTSFCQSCYALFLEDKIPFRVCSRAHEHLKIPVLETRFKEGEVLVDGKVMTLEDWKKSIKKKWIL